MNDAGLPNSPAPARLFDVTDAQLSAELKKWTGAAPALQPVGELLDRHWEAAFAYARLCTDGARSAGMLTTASFTRLFGETLRHNGPTAAWRPQLLVTVRRIAAEWDTDRNREQLHPDLRSETEDGGRAAARLLPSAERRLLSAAFQRLPQSARCLLWHHEVEAEPMEIPASLLGLDEEAARLELGRARERLREECLQVHRELAPEQECRSFLRMLDVTYRRGGVDVDPDLRAHLDRCEHCRDIADQLHQFGAGLGVALAEAVLGWGGAAYVEMRSMPQEAALLHERPVVPGEAFFDGGPAAPRGSGTRRTAKRAARRAAARRRNLTAAVVTVSGLVVIPLVLWSLGNGDSTAQAGGSTQVADAPGTDRSTNDPTWVGSGDEAQGDLSGRLHNVDSGLCVSVAGGKAVQGAEVQVAKCAAAPTELWTYRTDGLLRSVAEPDLCLDSHIAYSVRLAPCTAAGANAKNVRYDFTLQGNLVPRWDQDLALTPAATDGTGALVAKSRQDEAEVQRWVFDTSKTDPQMEWVNWGAATETSAPPAPSPTPTPKKASPTPTPSASASTAQPSATTPTATETSCAATYSCDWDGGYGGGYGSGDHHGGGGRR
ncbi:ricin-type beta-trefoil lectin domain protein [Streptomyces sp. NPDC090106]|uniref:ricin-type beta-trefoil lectin domain protein n=1 Tax=Streptomyces sp. NPDC090106 TaxID=3365946 RepID=UPI003812C813